MTWTMACPFSIWHGCADTVTYRVHRRDEVEKSLEKRKLGDRLLADKVLSAGLTASGKMRVLG